MNLILIGGEYSGTTTLANKLREWGKKTFGGDHGWHDHWKIPHLAHGELTEEELQQILNLSPNLKEQYQRYLMEYHLQPSFYSDPDFNLVGFCYDEVVYGPLYYGYGDQGAYSGRAVHVRRIEKTISVMAPETVLILLKCSPEVIRERMKKDPHKHGLLKDKDVEHVLNSFEQQFDSSILRRKMTLDSTSTSPDKLIEEFEEKFMEAFLTDIDRQRLIVRSMKKNKKNR